MLATFSTVVFLFGYLTIHYLILSLSLGMRYLFIFYSNKLFSLCFSLCFQVSQDTNALDTGLAFLFIASGAIGERDLFLCLCYIKSVLK